MIEASEAITSIENRQDSRAFEEPQSAANLRSAVDAHQLTEEKALAFRKADLQILSMKYPNAAISDFSVQIDFSCSDPDWVKISRVGFLFAFYVLIESVSAVCFQRNTFGGPVSCFVSSQSAYNSY